MSKKTIKAVVQNDDDTATIMELLHPNPWKVTASPLDDPCEGCGAEAGEPCRPSCLSHVTNSAGQPLDDDGYTEEEREIRTATEEVAIKLDRRNYVCDDGGGAYLSLNKGTVIAFVLRESEAIEPSRAGYWRLQWEATGENIESPHTVTTDSDTVAAWILETLARRMLQTFTVNPENHPQA